MIRGFQKATKKQARLRAALIGPAGAGKTYTALALATRLGSKVAVIDTEHGSAAKYADLFAFDVLELDTFAPATYIEAIKMAESSGYDVIVIDSLSHAWMGKDGALEQVDKAAKRGGGGGNSFAAWRDVTPQHNALVEALLACKAHVIGTMRAKTHYEVSDGSDGRRKGTPFKVGLAPVQKDGLEYEFDLVADIDQENTFVVTKTRCPALSGFVAKRAGEDVASVLRAWLTDGEALPTPAPPAVRPLVPELLAPELLRRLAAAPSLDAVKAVARDVKTALDAGHLAAADLEALRAERARVEALLASVAAERAAVPS
jgi:hypothetical protein